MIYARGKSPDGCLIQTLHLRLEFALAVTDIFSDN
jgi:hypothetical protein